VEVERVIVTGSNIPTAEETGPDPIDTYRPADIEKLGIRNATDLTTFLPQEAGGTANLNITNGGGKNIKIRDGNEKKVMPVSTAEYNPCGWHAWLNNTTITLGMQNVFDEDLPFVAGSGENGYDESLATIKGRFWYVQIKKRF